MAYDVYLLNFNKNNRSTSVPGVSGLTPLSFQMKTPSSILNPVIIITESPANHAAWANANYAYIPDFNRYYFITNTVFNGIQVELSLSVDVLASWKTVIRNSTQYVLRSASSYNGAIRDTKYPVKAVNPDRSITYGTQIANPLQPAASSFGVIVVGVVNKSGSLTGCVTYYAMSYLVFMSFMQQLFNLTTQWGAGGADLADGLKKAITDPMQYVVSAQWLPYSVNDFVNRGFVTSVNSITVGYDTISLSASAYMFTDSVLNIEFTNMLSLTIPDHPQATSRGSYLNFEPYSRYFFSFYPFCGLCEIDSTLLGGKGTLYVVYSVDLRTGKGICSLCTEYNGSSYTNWTPRAPFRVFEAQIGVPLPVSTIHTELQSLSQYITNTGVAASNEFGGFPQTFSKIENTLRNAMLKGLSALTNNEELQQAYSQASADLNPITTGDLSKIASNAAAMKSTCEMVGSQGTISTYSRMPVAAWGNFYYITDANDSLFGRPLCQSTTLSSLSGFCQCDTPKINAAGMMLQEQIEIERHLSIGVFLE
mgnify:CR=1 FL=1